MHRKGTVLITGATGFVGRTVTLELSKLYTKKQILCLGWIKDDEVNTKNREMLQKKGFSVELVDLVSKIGLKKIPKSPDVVVHMAANVNTADPDHRINDIGTQNLINYLDLKKRSHFIYTSTTVHTIGGRDYTKGITEDTIAVPTNEYGRTKLNAEKILKRAAKKQGFALTILRLCTVYGPDPRPNSMFLQLPEMIKKNSLFTRINWPGMTAIVHVKDVAYVIKNVADKFKPDQVKINLYIVYSENIRMYKICKHFYKSLKIEYNPIVLPEVFWELAKLSRFFIPLTEKFLSSKIYGSVWRASLIVDDVIWCKSINLEKLLPRWKKKKLTGY